MCSDCRQTQVQHCGPISENVSVSLLDVLHQVPTLPELLTQGSQLALSATCKSFRLQFFAQVQVVTVLREEDYALVPQRKWPRLNLVILQDAYSYCSVSLPENIRIVKIHISDADGRAIVSMLRPLHNPASDLPSTRLAAQQLAHQMRLRWPLMGSFTMSDVHNLDGLGNKIVSQLVTGRWTHLVRLLLSDCDLQAEEFLLLGQGNWPGLMWLDVSGSSLDAKGMAWLAKGNWPRLFSIKLSVNPTLGARAIAQLGAANWLKEELVITDTPFSTDMAAALADLQLPKLRELRLKGSGLTAAAVSELARADWPNLRDLSMHHDDLDAVAVVLGKVDELKSNTSFDAQYCAFTVSEQRMLSWPDMGLWPNLSQIRVSKRSVHLWL